MSDSNSLVPQVMDDDIKRIVSSNESLDNFLALQVNINSDGNFYEKSCPLCNSPSRNEAEKMWLKDRNADDVFAFLKNSKEKMPVTVIKNHMEFHIDQAYIELRKKEYVNRISQLSKSEIGTFHRVEIALSSINERLIAINSSEDPSVPQVINEKIKSEITCKLITSMTKLLELRANLMGEMLDKGDLLTIKQIDFENIFRSTVERFSSAEAREIVGFILDQFSQVAKKK